MNDKLGCNKCCEDIIPGFHVYNHELMGYRTGYNNKNIHNPYDRDNIMNQIGDIFTDDTDEIEGIWTNISDFLKIARI